jgi:hypothetical protein
MTARKKPGPNRRFKGFMISWASAEKITIDCLLEYLDSINTNIATIQAMAEPLPPHKRADLMDYTEQKHYVSTVLGYYGVRV